MDCMTILAIVGICALPTLQVAIFGVFVITIIGTLCT